MRSRRAGSSALILLLAVSACSDRTPDDPDALPLPSSAPASSRELPCDTAVTTGPLPEWARQGFSPPDVPVAQVRGVGGEILGVVFGNPLRAPNVAGHGNKILWVTNRASTSQRPATAQDPDLRIHATLNGSDLEVDRVVEGGPGPSSVDMPEPGCWTFTLEWSGQVDQLAVPYS